MTVWGVVLPSLKLDYAEVQKWSRAKQRGNCISACFLHKIIIWLQKTRKTEHKSNGLHSWSFLCDFQRCFMFHIRKKVMQLWSNIRVSKWWQNWQKNFNNWMTSNKKYVFFILQWCIQLIKSDSKDICYKRFLIHINVDALSIYQTILKKNYFHKNTKQHNCFQHW